MAKKETTDLSLLADRFLAFFAYELADQKRFNDWIENIMCNREHNPGALSLLTLLLNKALPTPQAVKMSSGEEGFTLRVLWEPAPSAALQEPGQFEMRIKE